MSYADDVRKFMKVAGQEVRTEPTVISDQERWQRYCYLTEEVSEMKQALADLKKASEYGNRARTKAALVDLGDALADIVFVTIGTAHAYGLDFDGMWAEVARSNMAKFPDGVAVRDENNKVVKPHDWVAPDIKGVLFPSKH